jgi:hypothetical protein
MSPISSIPGRHEAANSDATSPPATKTVTPTQHKKHEGTSDIPNNEAGTPAKTNPYAPPYAAYTSVDVAEASEKKTLIKTGATHNFTQAAVAYDTAAAAADTAGAASASLKEATSPAEQSDHAATTCTYANLAVYIQPIPTATSVPGKNTKSKKRDIRGEADPKPLTIEIPKSSNAPNNPNAKLPRNKMHQYVKETQWKLSKQIPTEVKITRITSYRKTNKQPCIASTLLLGGGNPCNKKRKHSDLPKPAPYPSSNQHTAESLALMLDTCTDTEFTTIIQQLPSDRQATNRKGTLVTKRQPAAPGPQSVSPSCLTELLATCTDEQFTCIIHSLPTGWNALNEKRNTVTKRQLEMAHWGGIQR